MKYSLMELKEKILLRKRSIIETINDELKGRVLWRTHDIANQWYSLQTKPKKK